MMIGLHSVEYAYLDSFNRIEHRTRTIDTGFVSYDQRCTLCSAHRKFVCIRLNWEFEFVTDVRNIFAILYGQPTTLILIFHFDPILAKLLFISQQTHSDFILD